MNLIIGILGRPNKLERDIISFSKALIDVINDNDNIPLGIIPNNKDILIPLLSSQKERLYRMIDLCDGIILQGGISPYDYDIEAIKYINQKNMPLLGICLGMQSLAIATGGKMSRVENHQYPDQLEVHDVIINKDSKLYDILKTTSLIVNSRHVEQITDSGQYKIVGKALDGTIEVLEHPSNTFNLGVQWHPEDMYFNNEKMKLLFITFFMHCQNYNQQKNDKNQ